MTFEQAYREHWRFVLACARRMAGPNDADDVAQVAWIRAWRAWGQFRGDSLITTWLYTAVRTTWLNMVRRHRHWDTAINDDPDDGPLTVIASRDPDPAESAMRREYADTMAGALAGTLVGRYLETEDYGVIASERGLPLGTVKSRIFREREKLKLALQT